MKDLDILAQLAQLGIKPEEGSIYLLLLKSGSLEAKDIASARGIIVNSVYRSVRSLMQHGLIAEITTNPKRFQAVAPNIAIKRLADSESEKLLSQSRSIIDLISPSDNPNHLTMELLTGREALFDKYVEFASKAEHEILVISIGEEVPESIWMITQEALTRGVEPKFIFHKNDADNKHLILRWLAMGVPVRHLFGEGYHLNIFDNHSAILSASNPKTSSERTGVVIYNDAIIGLLRTYFFQSWDAAKKLSLHGHIK